MDVLVKVKHYHVSDIEFLQNAAILGSVRNVIQLLEAGWQIADRRCVNLGGIIVFKENRGVFAVTNSQTQNKQPHRMPHIHDPDGLCWCEPTQVVILNEYHMIQEFGEILPGLNIPCSLWKHRADQ